MRVYICVCNLLPVDDCLLLDSKQQGRDRNHVRAVIRHQ